jgi:hypothetical protein
MRYIVGEHVGPGIDNGMSEVGNKISRPDAIVTESSCTWGYYNHTICQLPGVFDGLDDTIEIFLVRFRMDPRRSKFVRSPGKDSYASGTSTFFRLPQKGAEVEG